jgi:hypothetical protein
MSNKTENILFCEISPVTYSFLLLTDNVQSVNEAVQVVTTTFQRPLMVAQWLRYCATNRKVAGSIPDGVIGIFH